MKFCMTLNEKILENTFSFCTRDVLLSTVRVAVMCKLIHRHFTLHAMQTHVYQHTHTHTHTGFQNPQAFGCRVLRGELPAARVVLSNNTLKWIERERGAKRRERERERERERVRERDR